MPELPEVECVRRKLYNPLLNKTINEVDVLYSKYNCLKNIKSQKILDIKRLGKYLIFCLSDFYMISHLRMEGKYFIRNDETLKKHDLVRFRLDDFNLIYNDTRKFGMFYVFDKSIDIYKTLPLSKVAKEPFTITKEELFKSLSIRKEFIKAALLDQTIISGLGNIYVDEVLYMSSINPYRKACDITINEIKKIIDNSITVLNNSINKGGSTIKSFSSLDGEIGHFQNDLLCHNKEYSRCNICNGFIIKDKCNGRGTYYCPSCQPLKERKLYAITGGFSSGKSTVLKTLYDLNEETISLDDLYNDLLNTSIPLKRELKKTFNATSKEELKTYIFRNEEAIKKLNDITHKYIYKEMFRIIDESDKKRIFIEVPLLFESKMEKCFTKTITVLESETIRETLLKNKGYTIEDYKERMKNQLSPLKKSQMSDLIVYNKDTLSSLKKEVTQLIKDL